MHLLIISQLYQRRQPRSQLVQSSPRRLTAERGDLSKEGGSEADGAGRERGRRLLYETGVVDLAKALDPGGKPPQGRARDSVVLSIRPPSWPVCVYKVNEPYRRSHSSLWTYQSCLCLRCPVLCAAPHSVPPPPPATRTGLSRRPLSIVPASVSVAGFVVVGVTFCLPPFRVRCSSPFQASHLLSSLVLPSGTTSGHPRSHHCVA